MIDCAISKSYVPLPAVLSPEGMLAAFKIVGAS